MKTYFKLFVFVLVISTSIKAQKMDTIRLKEVEVTSNRIVLPFSKNSRTIQLITSEDIQKSPATNVADLLQNVAGIDVRRRGVDGMQSDLYIRGGNFDQTLVLIDGVKMDDPQTGHHSMNAILDIQNIERIEIIKGPAARIYGQNAFNGAINIVTKKVVGNSLKTTIAYGSYENKKADISLSQKLKNGGVLASVGYQKSDGYRFNTDFENFNAFIKANCNNFNLTTSFTSRNFGANGFYASPDYKDQYEETQTSLVVLDTKIKTGNLMVKPRIYWRRNQDMYLFLRHNPAYYRNLHISNKIGAETNVVLNSSLGKTGIGVDVARVFLASNNLGYHQRTVVTGFLEHRFEFHNFDVTPGVAISSYSDFNTKAFPGIDVGYRISDAIKLYSNVGYTYRVPTFTDLFYVGPTTLGNANLTPESAISEEIGFKYTGSRFYFDIALFHRKSDDLIDWTKDNFEDKWEARNFSEVVTKGFESSVNYNFNIGAYVQNLALGYSYIDDDIKDNNVSYTRYSLNSIKHHFTSSFTMKFSPKISQNVSYRYVERTHGESYNVVDAKIMANISEKIELTLNANNIFNASYTETNLVPMPKGNVLLGFKYNIY